jgi:peptidoglycan/LPS O-acetylase OafA/YrhL
VAPVDGAAAASRGRLATLDGLRGVAIVLVVLSHGWVLWPVDWFDEHWVIRPLMRSGNTAVTVFLLVSGFLTYQALTGRRGAERMHPEVTFLRRLVRVAPSLWVMLGVLMLVSLVDPTDETAWSDNRDSVLHVVTYTWNWYVQENLLTSRPDFGHLWYLSVDMQAFVIVSALLFMMRRRPVGVLFLLGGFYLLLTWWRFHVTETEFVFQVLVRTTARMDAFVLGVIVAAAVPLLGRLRQYRTHLDRSAAAALLLLVPISWWTAADVLGDGDHQFLTWGGTFLQLDLAILVGAVALGGLGSAPVRAVGVAPLAALGRRSLLLYIWHYPIFVFVERHWPGWTWPAKAAVALAIVLAVCVVLDRVVERRVERLSTHPRWRLLDDGLATAIGRAARRRLGRDRETATS